MGMVPANPSNVKSAEEESLLLTVPQVAAALQVSRDTVWAMIADGKLGHVRLGSRQKLVRIPRSEIVRWLASATVPAIGGRR